MTESSFDGLVMPFVFVREHHREVNGAQHHEDERLYEPGQERE
jgi:hypothetical protein